MVFIHDSLPEDGIKKAGSRRAQEGAGQTRLSRFTCELNLENIFFKKTIYEVGSRFFLASLVYCTAGPIRIEEHEMYNNLH